MVKYYSNQNITFHKIHLFLGWNNLNTIQMQNQIPNHKMTPQSALNILKEGNKRFIENHMEEHDLAKEVKLTSVDQHPYALILNCIDSRVPVELIFDLGIGDVFNTRIAGNIINDDIIGSMEFACTHGGSKMIVVLGHTSCGAIQAACDKTKLGKFTSLLKKIEPAIYSIPNSDNDDRSSKNNEFVDLVAKQNVKFSVENIKQQSPLIRKMIDDGEIGLVGAMYNISNGKVKFGV